MTLLRCGRIPVERLQLATAEVAAFIPPEKMHLLREIYRVGREEEKYRLGEIPGSTTIMVASSAEISPASDDSPIYPEPVRALSHSSSSAGISQLGIPQMQRPPSRPRSAQPSFPMDELQNNPFNPNGNPPAKRQKTSSPQGPQGQHVMNYPDMYQQQYYNFQLAGQHPQQHPQQQPQQPNQIPHSQSQLLYPTHGQNLRYQPEIKSAPPGQQQFFVFPPDFPSPPSSGGFHTQFPHDHHHQQPPTSHSQHPQQPQPTHPPTFGAAAYAAAQQLSSLRETTSLQPPPPTSSGSQQLPEPQPTPQHASTSSHFLNQRSSPYLPTPLRAAGIPGTGVSAGPNVSFSEFLNSPMTTGPGPASDGAVGRIRRGEKRRASDDSADESSDDEGTIDGDRSPSKKV